MLTIFSLKIETESGNREIYVSPFLLQSKEPPLIKSGEIKINKWYFYEELIDEVYNANLAQEVLAEKFRSRNYVINYGQDFKILLRESMC